MQFAPLCLDGLRAYLRRTTTTPTDCHHDPATYCLVDWLEDALKWLRSSRDFKSPQINSKTYSRHLCTTQAQHQCKLTGQTECMHSRMSSVRAQKHLGRVAKATHPPTIAWHLARRRWRAERSTSQTLPRQPQSVIYSKLQITQTLSAVCCLASAVCLL